MPAEIPWTDEQRDAITATGSGLLVSAAAGSGKTAVLAERCIHLICDAEEKCDITQLLVVTFTEAATAQMKERISHRLAQRMNHSQGADFIRLRRQQMLIDQAHISTLHGFCMRLIRQHFHRLELDPTLRVLDADEAALLRAETVRQLFMDRYEAGDVAFAHLLESYGDGRDERLTDLVLSAHAIMESLVDPKQWRKEALDRITEAAELPLHESRLGREYLQLIRENLNAVAALAARNAILIPPTFPDYLQCLQDIVATIDGYKTTLDTLGYDTLVAASADYSKQKLKGYSETLPGKQQAKAAADQARQAMEDLRHLLSFSSDHWRTGLGAISADARTFLDIVEDFSTRYQSEKSKLRGLDFTDQERMALRLLEHPEITRWCHTRFKHVLVDEYQDINQVQETILLRASREGQLNLSPSASLDQRTVEEMSPDTPQPEPLNGASSNLFCVGDVKQSIYRFRTADPRRFLEKSKRFSGGNKIGRVIHLKANFRSRAPLLQAINGVFEILMTEKNAEIEYDLAHRLVPGADFPPADNGNEIFTGAPVELHILDKEKQGSSDDDAEPLERIQQEAMLIVQQIRKLIPSPQAPGKYVYDKGSGSGGYRPIKYSDMVILLRATAHKADEIAEVLRSQNIPVHCDRGGGFFESLEIQDMLALLNLLDNQQQDVPLAAVLRSPLVGTSADALAQIRVAFPRQRFHRAVKLYAEQKKDAIADRLNDFFHNLADWRQLAQRRPLADVVWTIYRQTGYLTFCAGLQDGPQRQANLLQLHRRCKQFGQFSRGLYHFLRFIDELRRQQDTARPPLTVSDRNAVRIMTIHASKGLEFPIVFLPDLGKQHNCSDARGNILVHRDEFLGMMVADHAKQIRYPSLSHVLVRKNITRESLAEELRLLYVAMTRAKEHLILIGTDTHAHVEACDEQWNSHSGPLPIEYFSNGRTMLDWLLPAAAMLKGGNKNAIAVIKHDLTTIASWSQQPAAHTLNARQKLLANWSPLSSEGRTPAEPDDTATRIIQSLSYQYPHAGLTALAATRSVSSLSKQGRFQPIVPDSPDPADNPAPLRLPRQLIPGATPPAAEIGVATHLVLQYLDFSSASDQPSITRQIDSMVTRRLLTAEQRLWVDIDSILWLLSTEAGIMLRQYSGKILRELPIYTACDPVKFDPTITSIDPADRVMLRGRLDAAIPTSDGLVLVDYKTDHISQDQVSGRTELYTEQLKLYREALTRITGTPVNRSFLAFLTPRQLQRID